MQKLLQRCAFSLLIQCTSGIIVYLLCNRNDRSAWFFRLYHTYTVMNKDLGAVMRR